MFWRKKSFNKKLFFVKFQLFPLVKIFYNAKSPKGIESLQGIALRFPCNGYELSCGWSLREGESGEL